MHQSETLKERLDGDWTVDQITGFEMVSELVDFTINEPKLSVFKLDGNLERNNEIISAHFAIERYITKTTDKFTDFCKL